MRTIMKRYAFPVLCLSLALSAKAEALPHLQVGAPGPPGTYADYQASLSSPTENDTAVTSGSTLYVAGAYSVQQELLLGGQYTGTGGPGGNWSDKGFNSIFDTHRALLLATVPDGTLGGIGNSLTVDSFSAIYATPTYEDGFVVPTPPSNHAPIQDQDYLFFDIGDFGKNVDLDIPDFATEVASNQDGEIKTLSIAVSGFPWVHFDIFALLTDTQGGGQNVRLVTTLEGNPGSHDVTWKTGDNGGGGGGGGGIVAPEPSTLLLLGIGLVGLGLYGRKRLGR